MNPPTYYDTNCKADTIVCIHPYRTTVTKPNINWNEIDADLPSPRVPNELLDRIIELTLPGSISCSEFTHIAAFTLASTSFRQIALRRYFHDVTVHSQSHWIGLFKLLCAQEDRRVGRLGGGGFKWLRTLCASSTVLLFKHTWLTRLTHLQALSVDFAQEGLSTQHTRMLRLCKPFLQGSTSETSFHLASLTLTSLPRIDAALLHLIARTFPSLIDLYLSSTERLFYHCCYTCFDDSLSCTIHSPIPDTFSGVDDLAVVFANALKPLKNLTHIHLGIFLSDEQLIHSHIDHALNDYGPNTTAVYGPDECTVCDWLAPVKSVRLRELAASLVIAQTLKTIRSIGWSSFFCKKLGKKEKESDDEDDDDDGREESKERKTKVWVLRQGGRIRVRRAPWLN